MLFRRSAHLVAYWSHGGLRVRNYATGRAASLSASTFALLDVYSTWRSVEDAAGRQTRFNVERVRRMTSKLLEHGFLLRSDQEPDAAEQRMRALEAWNPAAGFFHSATRDVRFAPLNEARTVQRAKAAEVPWPGATYTPDRAAMKPLPDPARRSAVTRAFLNRRSWRRFGPGKVKQKDLATLLWLTGGVQHWVQSDVGEFALKTSPSGGSLHPIELYVLARRVDGLDEGIYHYSASGHGLSLLDRHTTSVPVRRYLPQQPWFEGAAAIVFFVAHYERALWRYTYPRAYRAPFVEAGHLAQTWCVTATELGLAPFVSMALVDSAIERAIGADGITRAALYAAGVGIRPRGVDWAPSPEGLPDAAKRPHHPARD